MDADRDLLGARPGGADHPDRAAANHVGESKGDAVDDRGATVRAHHHQVGLAGVLLERQLGCGGDVVAEDHHVQAEPQRFERLGRRVVPGNRDEREAQRRVLADGHLNTGRRRGRGGLVTGVAGCCGQQFVGERDRLLTGLLGTRDCYHEVVGPDLEGSESRLGEIVDVGRRRHDHRRGLDARDRRDLSRDRHQGHRVLVEVGVEPRTGTHRAVMRWRRGSGRSRRPNRRWPPVP